MSEGGQSRRSVGGYSFSFCSFEHLPAHLARAGPLSLQVRKRGPKCQVLTLQNIALQTEMSTWLVCCYDRPSSNAHQIDVDCSTSLQIDSQPGRCDVDCCGQSRPLCSRQQTLVIMSIIQHIFAIVTWKFAVQFPSQQRNPIHIPLCHFE